MNRPEQTARMMPTILYTGGRVGVLAAAEEEAARATCVRVADKTSRASGVAASIGKAGVGWALIGWTVAA